MKKLKPALVLFSALLISAVLISCMPKDCFIRLPFNTFIIKLVDLPYDSHTSRSTIGYETQSWEKYLDYYREKGYTFLGIGDAGSFEFEKDGVVKEMSMPNVLQFCWFI